MKRSNVRLVFGLSVLTALGCGDDSKTNDVCLPTADAGSAGPSIGTDRADASSDAHAPSANNDASSGASAFPFTPSNVALGEVPALPAGSLTISDVCEFDSEVGTFDCPGQNTHDDEFAFAVANIPGSGRVGILRTRKLQIDVAGQLLVHGSLPLILIADDEVQIAGTISATAQRGKTWAGGFAGSTIAGPGSGPGAGKLGSDENTQFDASSGAGYCGVGGTGATKDPAKPGAVGGPAYGSPTLIPLIGGSSGGGEEGGPGGGAVQLVSATQITIASTGVISAGGAGGGNGSCGGGAGGSILLEAPSVSVLGVLAANGGGGGASSGGAAGQAGLPSADKAPGAIPSLLGGGSGGDDINGQAGGFMTNNAALGGGGGAGRIRINTTAAPTLSGVLSPSVASTCATTGSLAAATSTLVP